MNSSCQRIAFVFLLAASGANACGPYFPDTVLDLPQAALRVRGSCLFDEMIAIDRSHGRGLSRGPRGEAMVKEANANHQRDWEIPEKEWERRKHQQFLEPVIAAGMTAELALKTNFGSGQTGDEAMDLALLLLGRDVDAARVAEVIDALAAWRATLSAADFAGPFGIPTPVVAAMPAPPDFPEVPADIRAYWAAARAFHAGDPAKAREGWQAILDMPATEHGERAVWAAWMLAKTSRDAAGARVFYQKTVNLAEAGCRDVIGLAPLARGWLAWNEADPVAALQWYFEAACSGEEPMFVSLRWQLPKLFDGGEKSLSRAAADPLVREIVTALLFTMRHGPDTFADPADDWSAAWLAQLEKLPSDTPSPSAAKAAWICYSRGDFDAARRWLDKAPPDAGEILWLRAKLALRAGRMDEAARLFAKAAPTYQFASGTSDREPRYAELVWFDHGGRRDWMRGQFDSDRAIVHIGRGEFLRAMDFLARAGYHDDAAYIAERVLTTDELVGWIRKNRPASVGGGEKQIIVMDANGSALMPDGDWMGDPLRYLLARRLAREFRFREASEFMPPALNPLFMHYVRLHREAKSDEWPKETKAAILWNLASLRRHLGMEFFGYEGAPDNTRWSGSYPALDFAGRRQMKTGWQFEWDPSGEIISEAGSDAERAIPIVAREELQRLPRQRPRIDLRFHYRYEAADIAWRAAALMPDNDRKTLAILHQAGRWLADRDPKAADRFYQKMLRRCGNLPEARELDRRRWFLPEAPQATLPELPAPLRFAPSALVRKAVLPADFH